MERKAVVNHSDLLAVVAYLWDGARADYVHFAFGCGRTTDVSKLADGHIFHQLTSLAVACGFVESKEDVWFGIRKELGLLVEFDND